MSWSRDRHRVAFCLMFTVLQHCVHRHGGVEASQHEKQLYSQLSRSYSKHVRPVKRDEDPVHVRVAFSLVEVLSIDEDNGQLAVKAWLTMNWRDEYLTWNPDLHGGITRLNFDTGPDGHIWTPDIVVFSALKTEIDHHVQAVVSAGGSVTWIQPAVYVVRCRHEFRGNSWVAGFQLGSWTYDDQLVDLQPMPLPLGSARPGQEEDNEVDVDVDSFSSNDHWAMLDHAGRREVRKVACCEDPRLDAHYGRHQSPSYVSLHYLLKLRKKLGPSLLGRRRRK